MKKTFKHIIILQIIVISLLGFTTSCSDWTEQEQIVLDQVNIQEQDPVLYAKYLDNLRAYKKTSHKKMVVWFNNAAKIAKGRIDNITALPDSVDIVVLMFPNDLPEWQLEEIKEVREEKGTKFLLPFDFDNLKEKYDDWKKDVDAANDSIKAKALADAAAISKETGETVEPEAIVEIEIPPFDNYLVDSLNVSTSILDKYEYDGMALGYKGKGINLMTDAEKMAYTDCNNLFMGIVNDWVNRNTDNIFAFKGYPQNLLNKDLLTNASLIIIPCLSEDTESAVTYQAVMAATEGVPSDKLAIQVLTTSLDEQDTKTGYWNNGDINATIGAAKWSTTPHDGFKVAGLSIYNVSNDYYTLDRTYSNVRSAINIINPAIK